MELDLLLIAKAILGMIAFILIVKFIFTSSHEEKNLKITKAQLREELEEIKKNITKKKKIPTKEEGELMDSVMEDYYQDENLVR
jgi:hypothetical protein